MDLKSKQVNFTAEMVGVIIKAIKEGKERELPTSIYHAYEKGDIYIGVGNNILALIADKYEKVPSEKYLLVCSIGGELSIIDDIFSIKSHYDISE